MTVAFLGVGGAPGAGEILLVLLAILLLFGSRRLPTMARSFGRALAAMRRAADDVRGEILSADEDDEPPVVKRTADPGRTESENECGERDAS